MKFSARPDRHGRRKVKRSGFLRASTQSEAGEPSKGEPEHAPAQDRHRETVPTVPRAANRERGGAPEAHIHEARMVDGSRARRPREAGRDRSEESEARRAPRSDASCADERKKVGTSRRSRRRGKSRGDLAPQRGRRVKQCRPMAALRDARTPTTSARKSRRRAQDGARNATPRRQGRAAAPDAVRQEIPEEDPRRALPARAAHLAASPARRAPCTQKALQAHIASGSSTAARLLATDGPMVRDVAVGETSWSADQQKLAVRVHRWATASRWESGDDNE